MPAFISQSADILDSEPVIGPILTQGNKILEAFPGNMNNDNDI
jgi:hypothetical protein